MKCSCSSFIFWIFFLRNEGLTDCLTTAKQAVPTSARPTTINKVIEVLPDTEKSSTKDIFSLKSRRSATDIWDWDFWCQLQPKMGNCKNNETKYYYDAQLDQCLIFSYTGCKGNENRFDDKVDCERHCRGATYMPIKNLEYASACPMQPSAGLCLGYFQMYYYDINSHTCKTFVYGGCGGNKNRFVTTEMCMSECSSTSKEIYKKKNMRMKKSSSDENESDDGFWDALTTLDGGINSQEVDSSST